VVGVATAPGSHDSGVAAALSANTSQESARPSYAERREQAISRDAERPASDEPLRPTAADLRQYRQANEQLIRASRARSKELEQSRWALPVDAYRLTGRFGATSSLWSTVHTGLDFAAPTGQPIRSITKGTVTEAGSAGAYGYRTIVRAEDGTEFWYCHQNEISVSAGDKVGAGQVIGTVGSTGNVTGPHLHLEIRPEGKDPVDPETALREQGLAP
jgi:murein DD-endopeptidase MepM/ murein hydrolase activator NlpD